jgi:hypothetical protein
MAPEKSQELNDLAGSSSNCHIYIPSTVVLQRCEGDLPLMEDQTALSSEMLYVGTADHGKARMFAFLVNDKNIRKVVVCKYHADTCTWSSVAIRNNWDSLRLRPEFKPAMFSKADLLSTLETVFIYKGTVDQQKVSCAGSLSNDLVPTMQPSNEVSLSTRTLCETY